LRCGDGRVGTAVEAVVVKDIVRPTIVVISELFDTLVKSEYMAIFRQWKAKVQLTHSNCSESFFSGIFSRRRSGFQKVHTDSWWRTVSFVKTSKSRNRRGVSS
jgi:hypothetical protein